jgi:ribonucleoside-diphosphate reductase alpha chain
VKVNKSEEIGDGAKKGFGAPKASVGAGTSGAPDAAAPAAPRKGFGFGGVK